MSNYVDHNALRAYVRERHQDRVEAGLSEPYEIPDFTDDDLVGIRAGAEQLDAALREARQYDHAELLPVLRRLPDLRKMVTTVMGMHRRAWASRGPGENSPWPHDLGMMGELVERPRTRGGHWLSEFGEGTDYDRVMRLLDPDRSMRPLGVFAGKPEDIHVLTSEYNVDAWLASRNPKDGGVECDWKRYSYKWPTWASNEIWRNCHGGWTIRKTEPEEAPISYLVRACGTVLIAIATCDNCLRWLLAGGSYPT
ncbi:hypothetical protein [Mycolicibacterium tusciae]|uniref:hypothetical protein n=1 Tax=Mycolicibacterium tusciae TaxID=75922 RepID=UPI00024A26F0|nr:hypothetical protein [Mycolicibacterium tusciae]